MAAALGLSADEFRAAYVRRVGARLSLKEFPGGDCVLWGGPEKGCLVYAARPVQCKTFPFWPEHLRSRRAWDTLAGRCPGVNEGRVRSVKEIERRLKKRE